MEKNEVSHHEVRFYVAAKEMKQQWATSKDLASKAKIAERTSRAFASKYVSLGLFDVAEVFPAHRYRMAEKANKRNAAYVGRLERAIEVFKKEG